MTSGMETDLKAVQLNAMKPIVMTFGISTDAKYSQSQNAKSHIVVTSGMETDVKAKQ